MGHVTSMHANNDQIFKSYLLSNVNSAIQLFIGLTQVNVVVTVYRLMKSDVLNS